MIFKDHMVEAVRTMARKGLNCGRSGNLSVRVDPENFVITPSGAHPDQLKTYQLVDMKMTGGLHPRATASKPSSEWLLHRDIYRHFRNARVVNHFHSHFATTVACANMAIPAVTYEVAFFGGHYVPLADYALFGTQELSENVIDALTPGPYKGCLMESHGAVVVANDLDEAIELAEKLEFLSRVYWQMLQIFPTNHLPMLSRAQMAEVLEGFKGYAKS